MMRFFRLKRSIIRFIKTKGIKNRIIIEIKNPKRYDALACIFSDFPFFCTHFVDNSYHRLYNEANTEIEVAFFKSTFYEVSGADEEKGKERTPKVGTA